MKKFMGMIWPTDTTPRGALRLFEVGHGYRTCPKMCMADSLILPMAPTRGELLVVFTSVMAATCGLGGGRWDGSEMAGMMVADGQLGEKNAKIRRSQPRADARPGRGGSRHRARDALNAPARG